MRSGVSRRQDELLEGLVDLFLAHGFANYTLSDLAAQMHCSKTTLYSIAHSKEALVRTTLIRYFKGATERVEIRSAAEDDPAHRLVTYLRAVADELRPASQQFFDDVAADPEARSVYQRNTRIAAERISQIVAAGVAGRAFRTVEPAFVADLVASEMSRIQTGAVRAATGLVDADAYDALAELVVNGISS
jgi:AcrR family transcriptional regulator